MLPVVDEDSLGRRPATSAPVEVVGAVVVVFRRCDRDGIEVLMLHRAGRGVDYEGDWAWTPPAGQREFGETAAECARRELLEETGLDLVPWVTGCGTDAWPVYLAEARVGDAVCVEQGPEHDRYEWLTA